MMNKENKKNYIEQMKKVFSDNEAVMIAHYEGLNVVQLDKLRKELRENGIMFKITNSNSIENFDKYLKNLKQEAELENNFTNLGIDINKDYSKIISGVNILRLSNNPVELKKEDLKKIIQN